jgi:hypothetical protein
MAARKHIAKEQVATTSTSSAPNHNFKNPQDAISANGLIGSTVAETLDKVSDVLDFLAEFNARKAEVELTGSVIAGHTWVIEYARDALRVQMAALFPNSGSGARNG